jgi:hypothetical protein
VERFIAHHPDLQQEWQALLHCRLLPDQPIVFPEKEALYRIEMPEEEEEDLPHFSPDLSIVFPGKDTLYKHEEDRRIILLPWLRVAAAAAIMAGVALLVMFSVRLTNAPSAAQPIAKNNKNISPVTPAAPPALYSSGGRPARSAARAAGSPMGSPTVSAITDRAATHPATATRRTTGKPMREKEKVKISEQDIQEEAKPESKDLAQQAEPHDPVQTRPIDIAATRAADISATRAAVTTANVHPGDAVAALQTGIPREESSFATQALQHANENNDPENNILVSDEQAAPGKGKLRGLFRRVTRTFGKTADRDKDGQREVLVGAFQFALK